MESDTPPPPRLWLLYFLLLLGWASRRVAAAGPHEVALVGRRGGDDLQKAADRRRPQPSQPALVRRQVVGRRALSHATGRPEGGSFAFKPWPHAMTCSAYACTAIPLPT